MEMKTDVLGIKFDRVTKAEAVFRALDIIDSRQSGYIVTPNPEIVLLARRDPQLKRAIEGASLILADGVGITIGARILGTPLPERVPGIDFAEALIKELSGAHESLFLFGAKPGVAEKAAEKLKERYKGIVIRGTADGYFSDDSEIINKINSASPSLLLVCLGAPRQETWMHENCAKLDAGLMIGLGGALDVISGEVERAPERWRKLGLEWLHRLIKDPKRIKRMVRLPLFLIAVLGRRMGVKRGKTS